MGKLQQMASRDAHIARVTAPEDLLRRLDRVAARRNRLGKGGIHFGSAASVPGDRDRYEATAVIRDRSVMRQRAATEQGERAGAAVEKGDLVAINGCRPPSEPLLEEAPRFGDVIDAECYQGQSLFHEFWAFCVCCSEFRTYQER